LKRGLIDGMHYLLAQHLKVGSVKKPQWGDSEYSAVGKSGNSRTKLPGKKRNCTLARYTEVLGEEKGY